MDDAELVYCPGCDEEYYFPEGMPECPVCGHSFGIAPDEIPLDDDGR